MPELLTPERFRWVLLLLAAVALVLLYQLSLNGRYQPVPDRPIILDTRDGYVQPLNAKNPYRN